MPIIVADGIGESTARWVFASQKAHPFIGSQLVYAIIEMSKGVQAFRATLYLRAEMATRFGPISGLLPEESKDRLSWVLK
ncbi:MAG TPA: hypothetical protein VN455_10260 [Methanotrichaceae archaeon]|nr:hypothetical protein [Methanotrichaceae archaeon]